MWMMKQFYFVVLVGALLVLAAIFRFSCSSNPSQPKSTISLSHQGDITPKEEDTSNNRIVDGYDVFYHDLFDSHSIDGNEQINQFRLLIKSSLGENQIEDGFDYDLIDDQKKLNFTQLRSLMALLEKNRVFLVDSEVFNDLKLSEGKERNQTEPLLLADLSPSRVYPVVSSGKLSKHLSGKTYAMSRERLRLSFGLRMNLRRVDDLEKDLGSKLDSRCELKLATGMYENVRIVTGYYIICPYLLVHIAIFYDRGDFFWIGADEFTLAKKPFGDVPRAVNKFDLSRVAFNKMTFVVPSNLIRFKFDYARSKFLECNREMARSNRQATKNSYKQDLDKNSRVVPRMVHVTSYLESTNTSYWLAAGTLLGWRRDCGVIPHTSDVDFGIWSHEYDPRIRRHFTTDTNTRLVYMFGVRNDSYELRLQAESVTYDLFIVYKHNSTTQWCGYQLGKKKYRRYLHEFSELCSAEIFNHKFLVPCDPDDYLSHEYGAEWSTPLAKKYKWTNLVYLGQWEEKLWPNVLKQFDDNGRIVIVNRRNETNLNITHIVDYV